MLDSSRAYGLLSSSVRGVRAVLTSSPSAAI
jgi:hypothetical protein